MLYFDKDLIILQLTNQWQIGEKKKKKKKKEERKKEKKFSDIFFNY